MSENHSALIDHTLSSPSVSELEDFMTELRQTEVLPKFIKTLVWYPNGRIQIELTNEAP